MASAQACGSGDAERPAPSPLPSFECNICFDTPRDPVVTECGHLFCWRCLFKWMQTTTTCPPCPVCKAKVEKSKVIPVYGRGAQEQVDPREQTVNEERVPPRPRGHRTEVPFAQFDQNMGGVRYGIHGMNQRMGNPQFGSFTLTVLPSLFGLHIQYPPPGFGNVAMMQQHAQQQQQQQQQLHAHQQQQLSNQRQQPCPLTPEQEQQEIISKLLFWFALFVVLWFLVF